MNCKKQLLFFYCSRIFGLALKPVALWCAMRIGSDSWSDFFAKFSFIVPVTFIAFNSDAHIRYYQARFGKENSVLQIAFHFRAYLQDLVFHFTLFAGILLVGFFFYFGHIGPAISFLLFALCEKIFDEGLRYLLFDKKYLHWAFAFLLKAFGPLLALGMTVAFSAVNPAPILVLLSLLATGVLLWRLLGMRVGFLSCLLRRAFSRRLLKYWSVYRSRYMVNQLASLCAYNLLAVDKWLGSREWSPRMLAEVVLASQVGSFYLVLLDNLFFTTNRDRFVKADAKLTRVIHWPSMFGLSVSFPLLFAGMLYFVKVPIGFQVLTTPVILAILLCSVVKGFSRPIEEFAFWKQPRATALKIDALCIGFLLFAGKAILPTRDPFDFYMAILLVLMARTALYLLVLKQPTKAYWLAFKQS